MDTRLRHQNGDSSNTSPLEEKSSTTNSGQDQKSTLVARLEHFTWAWYTFPMSTGGLALLLSEQTQPHAFHGLQTIGKVVYIFDLLIFTLITIAITFRFIKYPHTFKNSITHPTEGLFLATPLLSIASIITGMARYGIPSTGPWLLTVYRVLFWIYFAITFLVAVGQYTLLFTSPELKIEDMTPAWDLPIFPFMLSGTIASTGAALQPPSQAVPMILAGLTAQGLGMLISILMYASYLRRMIQWGFPAPNTRPAMFIAVGPPSFTSLAIIGMANDFPNHYHYFGTGSDSDAITIQILRVMATFTAVFIWSLSFWFFCITTLANLAVYKQMTFHLNWWAFVFPNTGFTIATIAIGKTFRSEGIMWVGSVMSILLVVLYLFVLMHHVIAVLRKDIMYEGKDEDNYVKAGGHKKEKRGISDADAAMEQVKQA